jgi:hypothetical protein
MHIFSRLLLLCSALLAAFVLLTTTAIAARYPRHNFGDLMFLLPIITPLITSMMAASLYFLGNQTRMLAGWLWSMFACANLLLVHQALRVSLQYDLLQMDGTAYWSLLSVPAFCGWGATIILGGLLGLGIGLLMPRNPAPLHGPDGFPP